MNRRPPAADECRYVLPTAWGAFEAVFSAAGLRALYFPAVAADIPAPATTALCRTLPAPVAAFYRELSAYLAGKLRVFTAAPDLTGHSAFQIAVWEQLQKIPFGQTASYGEIALRLSKPGASRAVGNACGANPVPLVIPCHRVIASGGLGGFSAGRDWKLRLLALENG